MRCTFNAEFMGAIGSGNQISGNGDTCCFLASLYIVVCCGGCIYSSRNFKSVKERQKMKETINKGKVYAIAVIDFFISIGIGFLIGFLTGRM